MNIRILKNIVLDVEIDGKKQAVAFSFGDRYNVDRITEDNGFCDIYMSNGCIIRGIARKLFAAYNVVIECSGTEIPEGINLEIGAKQ